MTAKLSSIRSRANAVLSRRRACLMLAGLATPSIALAEDTPAPPQVMPQPVPPQLVPPPVTLPAPAAPALRPMILNAGQIDKSKIYYLFFDGVIDVTSMRNLRRQLTALVEAGVSQINLVFSSAGGLVEPTLVTYGFIRSLPAIINTHAQGFVQSAATVLFLAGQERSSDRAAQFLFHPSQSPIGGTVGEQQIQDRLAQFEAVDEVLAQIYKDRTSLTDSDIERFNHGQVIYTADQAMDRGVVQIVADLKIPGPQIARILILD